MHSVFVSCLTVVPYDWQSICEFISKWKVWCMKSHVITTDQFRNQESGKLYWAQWPATLNIHSTECM